MKILPAYKNSLHALQVLLRPGQGKEKMIRTPSVGVQISNDGRKYYFVEVCEDRSCSMIEAYGEEAEQLWKTANHKRINPTHWVY